MCVRVHLHGNFVSSAGFFGSASMLMIQPSWVGGLCSDVFFSAQGWVRTICHSRAVRSSAFWSTLVRKVALLPSSPRRVACSYDAIARCAVQYFSHCLRFHHGDMTLGGDRRERQTRLLIHGAPLSIPAVLLFMHKGFA